MRRTNQFTLIEVLSAMAIIAILMGLIIGGAGFASRRAAETKTLARLKEMEMALDAFREDRGYYPATSGVIQLVSNPPGTDFDSGNFRHSQTNQPYVAGYIGGEFLDAWGNAFFYRNDGSSNQNNAEMYDLWSGGRDKDHGINTDSTDFNNSVTQAGAEGSDDITNWKRYQ